MNKLKVISLVIISVLVVGIIFISKSPKEPLGAISINGLLANKNANERAEIKSAEIAKLNHNGIYENAQYGVRVEILSLSKIAGGVELFARAWKGTEQLGFGKDGSVDIERFRIINPPILLDDPNGTIVREWTDKRTGELMRRTLREDPIKAIQSILAHTIEVGNGKISDNIVKGKIGSTHTTYFPNANVETVSVDGDATHNYGAGNGQVWGTIRTAVGTIAADAGANIDTFYWIEDSTSGNFSYLSRGIYLFDTSDIDDGDTIDSATLSVVGVQKLNESNYSPAPAAVVVTSAPASNTALAAGDYDSLGTVDQSDRIAYGFLLVDSATYVDFTLNATGLGNVSKTGASKFGVIEANYDVDANTPTWTANNKQALWQTKGADAAGTTVDPTLVVTHSAVAAAVSIESDLIIFE